MFIKYDVNVLNILGMQSQWKPRKVLQNVTIYDRHVAKVYSSVINVYNDD